MTTDRSAHTAACGYSKWYDASARWQPNLPEGGALHPLSQLVREIMVEMHCDCCGSEQFCGTPKRLPA